MLSRWLGLSAQFTVKWRLIDNRASARDNRPKFVAGIGAKPQQNIVNYVNALENQ